MMALVTASHTSSWLNLDSWSETYVGARWLVENVLPEKQHQSSPEHGPISQMALLASHHMIEVMLFSCLKKQIEELSLPDSEIETKIRKLDKMRFHEAFTEWEKLVPSMGCFVYDSEPYISIDRLRLRRNETIHKKSALSSLKMARSAVYTAVTASKEIYQHFNKNAAFTYEPVLKKYPLGIFPLFGEIIYPEDRHKAKTTNKGLQPTGKSG
jgi:hypothetical protein